MNIRPKKIPKFQSPWSALTYNGAPSQQFNFPGYFSLNQTATTDLLPTAENISYGEKKRGILTAIPQRNNIYFKNDFGTYNQWHSDNIVMPFYDRLSTTPRDLTQYDFESEFRNALDSWNNAGGFDWLNANDEQRTKGLQSAGTKSHQDLYYNNPVLRIEDNIIGENNSQYVFPKNANSADYFQNNIFNDGSGYTYRTRVGRNGQQSDSDFGIQTGNRRPTIHISTNEETTKKWDEFFKNLGYVGAYQYLDHWIPTKDQNKARRLFDNIQQETKNNPPSQKRPMYDITPEIVYPNGNQFAYDYSDLLKPKKPEDTTEGGSIPAEHGDYGNKKFDWSKISSGLANILPGMLAAGRLYGSLASNEKIYDEALKGIKPDLRQTYNTYRQVVGDEATKQAYYRRATEGVTKAAQPFTSDADRQMAYMMDANRVANELRAQGDLADNQEIRRTSDESNQHQWANTQRATEVANANIASLNQANSLKHNLLAQKHAANWSSIDNYLQGIEYRLRNKQAENQSLEDQIWLLQHQNDLSNDEEYIRLQKEASDAYDKYIKPGSTQADLSDYLTKKRAYDEYSNNKRIQIMRSRPRYNTSFWSLLAKNGAKITYKKKEDLLYKSAKDTVEHFRKMSKLSSDAQNRKKSKIEKLTSHPKTRKMQQGGLAPFVVYKPVALGGETSTQVSSGSGTTKSSSKSEDSFKNIRDLFKELLGKGIPIDVQTSLTEMENFMKKQALFGNELDSSDMETMYIKQISRLNNIMFNNERYKSAQEIAVENDAINEYAVDSNGNLAVQNTETGKISFKKPSNLGENDNPLTNGQLLEMRAYDPHLAFNTSIFDVVSNGIGMSKIAQHIKSIIPSIKSNEIKEDSYVSNKLNQGIKALQEAPPGEYKQTITDKNNLEQAKFALDYIEGMLPRNMRTVLEINAAQRKISGHDLIASLISSQKEINRSIEYTAVTGKGKSGSGNGSDDGIEINSAVQLLLGMSSPREFTFNIGNGNSFTGVARVSSINDTNETPFGADFSYSEIYKSSLRKNLDLDNASFGDVPINKALKDRIIVDNSTIAGVDLPYTTDNNGRIIPDFKMLNKIEEADQEILKLGINPDQEPQKVNEIYAKYGLPIKYGTDNRLTGNYKRFAVIQATAIEDVFLNKGGLASDGTLTLVSDENEIDKYLDQLKNITGKKDIDMDRPGLFTGDKDIYKGSIFIPIIGDLTDAISGSKTGKLTENNYDDYRSKWNTKNYIKAPQFIKQ